MRMAGWFLMSFLLLITACSGEQQEQKITAVNPPEETACDVDGMILSRYPGPKGQIHYKDSKRIDYFCETKEVFRVYAEPGMPARIAAAFVQDAGETDWSRPEGHWIDATRAYYVVGSNRIGSMGKTYAPFSDKAKAEAFAGKYGGTVKTFDQLLAEVRQG